MTRVTPVSEPDVIHGYVDAIALERPDHPAFEFLDQIISYDQLARRSNALARYLISIGITPGDRVGIYMPKAIETPVALFGIMKAGAAYVPLDPSAPVERTAGLVNDCDISVIISSSQQRRSLKKLSRLETCLQRLIGTDCDISPWQNASWDEVFHQSDSPLENVVGADDLAYIIYTSGSTGAPKGIMHTHRSGLCFSLWAAREYGFTHLDRLSNHAPLHFDLSIMDYFSSVAVGATVVIIPEDYTKLPASYSQLIADRKITVLYTVPFALIQLLLRGALEQRDLTHLRYAIFGGEPFPTAHLRALMAELPHVKFDNIYGPAEVNGVSHFTVEELKADTESVPIGPIAKHAKALIVDDYDKPIVDGDIGELLVHSASMMSGYWRRPGLTGRSIFREPGEAGDAYYRTGDLVTRVDSVMRFIGRKDRQVKIRGYRVELDEVELALSALEEVEEGAAYDLEKSDGSREIHAEITVKTPISDTLLLMRKLKGSLPWYAVPSTLTTCSEFPRGTTGKIDRRRLQLSAQDRLDNESLLETKET
ncbi:MAG: amino acid adenylation domain-containing protein [Gammaproteobacteria bacterium]